MAKSKKSKRGVFIAVVVFILAVALVIASSITTGYLITGVANPTQWGGYVKPDTLEVIAVSSEGEAMREGCTYAMPDGITFFSARSAVDDTELVTERKLVLTPTLSNEYIKGEFDWSLEYSADLAPDDNSGAVEEHFTITPKDDGRQAELTYTSKFNVPIELTVTLRGTDSRATCVLSCMKDVQPRNLCWNMDSMYDELNFGAVFNVSENGIEMPEVSLTGVQISFNNDFMSEVQKYLKFNIVFTTAHIDYTNSPVTIPNLEDWNELEFDFKLNYSDFIKDFDNYDQAHKDAIYFAWHYVFNLSSTGYVNLEVNFCCSYLGQNLGNLNYSIYDCGYLDVAPNDWKTVTPDVNLNGNWTFVG
ncbi:MAG: hypothetical protein K2L12_08550 [Clostridia bacterium]|nr:hypothetical protein [Clostridia bacterium]